jgi:hypothetical protein
LPRVCRPATWSSASLASSSVEHVACTQAQQVVVVAWAGDAERAGPYGRRELHGVAANAARRGGDEHGLAGLQAPPLDQSLVGGPGPDHQPRRLLEAHPVGLARQVVREHQRQFGKPAANNLQIRACRYLLSSYSSWRGVVEPDAPPGSSRLSAPPAVGHCGCSREISCRAPGSSRRVWPRTRTLMGWTAPGRELTSMWSWARVTSTRWSR